MTRLPADDGAAERPLLDRFTQALAWIIHDERPDALSRPVTVAELYQDIAPYRRMRELAGIEIHADYEHALIRLLSGEGGAAHLDPETAAEALMIEADSIDPDLSSYRKYAACEVRLTLGERPASLPELRPPAPVTEPAPLLDRSSPPPSVAPVDDSEEPDGAGDAAGEPPPPAASPEPISCAYCGNSLPTDRDVRFCPFCGGDRTGRHCAGCGEGLEDDWRFCVACGASAAS